jgi:hypothetical protein
MSGPWVHLRSLNDINHPTRFSHANNKSIINILFGCSKNSFAWYDIFLDLCHMHSAPWMIEWFEVVQFLTNEAKYLCQRQFPSILVDHPTSHQRRLSIKHFLMPLRSSHSHVLASWINSTAFQRLQSLDAWCNQLALSWHIFLGPRTAWCKLSKLSVSLSQLSYRPSFGSSNNTVGTSVSPLTSGFIPKIFNVV